VKRLASFCKQLRLGQLFTIFAAVVLLFTSTACSSGNTQGANPNNPAVQAGGMNNPNKAGGDSFLNSKSSTDPNVNVRAGNAQSNRADLQLGSNTLLAAVASSENAGKLIYPGTNQTTGIKSILSGGQERILSKEAQQTAGRDQPTLVQRDPDANILEKIGTEFRDASAFLKSKSDEAGARPEAQSNPARHK